MSFSSFFTSELEKLSVELDSKSVSRESLEAIRSLFVVGSETLSNAKIGSLSTTVAEVDRASLAHNVLAALFPSSVINPSSPDYVKKTQAHWSHTCFLQPTCIVSPSSAKEVAIILKIITLLEVRFAVRSGGHNPNRGFASLETGVLIEMSRLNEVKPSEDRTWASIGAGCLWGEAYPALSAFDVSVIGGRSPEVGAAGVILGGGLNFFSEEHGLACDQVKNFEVVLANSTIVNANAQENSDLFKGLKGGGANFGIVTRLDLYAVPCNNVWYAAYLYAPDKTPALLNALEKYLEAAKNDPKAGLIFNLNAQATMLGFKYGAPTPWPKVFDAFKDFEPIYKLSEGTTGSMATCSKIYAGAAEHGHKRIDIETWSITWDIQCAHEIYNAWQEKSNEMSKKIDAAMAIGFQVIGENLIRVGEQAGGNVLGLSQPQIWVNSVSQWPDAANDQIAHKSLQDLHEQAKQIAKSRGSYLPFEFMNDAGWDQNVLASYGPENLTFLKSLSKKYDPEQVFQRLQNGGFLLSKA